VVGGDEHGADGGGHEQRWSLLADGLEGGYQLGDERFADCDPEWYDRPDGPVGTDRRAGSRWHVTVCRLHGYLMGKEPEAEDPLTRTGVLKAHFGEQYRFWVWVRGQFTPASVGIILSVVVTAATYIAHLRETVSAVTTRVVVLETRVIPVLDQSNKTAVLEAEIKDMGGRVDRLEEHWDNASDVASIPNDKLLRSKRRPR